ncbi:MAG: BrnT family toxin [Deltaproteobacteria bacterium]|nr:BrnT family toxin [Deltaproteobacteria bacterium]
MTMIEFEWDPGKNRRNKNKHGISFEEASTAFYDPRARINTDPDHSADEDRFLLLGLSANLKLLVVCHCYRKNDQLIRIYSARKANKLEATQYKEFLP